MLNPQLKIQSYTHQHPYKTKAPKRIAEKRYRYGFNGMEKDDEVKGGGNSYDFGARMYDSRLGRWLSIDPLANEYPFISPYTFALNRPILFIDKDGEAPMIKPPPDGAIIITRVKASGPISKLKPYKDGYNKKAYALNSETIERGSAPWSGKIVIRTVSAKMFDTHQEESKYTTRLSFINLRKIKDGESVPLKPSGISYQYKEFDEMPVQSANFLMETFLTDNEEYVPKLNLNKVYDKVEVLINYHSDSDLKTVKATTGDLRRALKKVIRKSYGPECQVIYKYNPIDVDDVENIDVIPYVQEVKWVGNPKAEEILKKSKDYEDYKPDKNNNKESKATNNDK